MGSQESLRYLSTRFPSKAESLSELHLSEDDRILTHPRFPIENRNYFLGFQVIHGIGIGITPFNAMKYAAHQCWQVEHTLLYLQQPKELEQ